MVEHRWKAGKPSPITSGVVFKPAWAGAWMSVEVINDGKVAGRTEISPEDVVLTVEFLVGVLHAAGRWRRVDD